MEGIKNILASVQEVKTKDGTSLFIPNLSKEELALALSRFVIVSAQPAPRSTGVTSQQPGPSSNGQSTQKDFAHAGKPTPNYSVEIEEPDDEYNLPGFIAVAVSSLGPSSGKAEIETVRVLLREERERVKSHANRKVAEPVIQGHLSALSKAWRGAKKA